MDHSSIAQSDVMHSYRIFLKKRWHSSCEYSLKVWRHTHMLYYALVFLLIALVAAAFGFGGIAGVSAEFAKILFVVFLVLFVVSLVAGRVII